MGPRLPLILPDSEFHSRCKSGAIWYKLPVGDWISLCHEVLGIIFFFFYKKQEKERETMGIDDYFPGLALTMVAGELVEGVLRFFSDRESGCLSMMLG